MTYYYMLSTSSCPVFVFKMYFLKWLCFKRWNFAGSGKYDISLFTSCYFLFVREFSENEFRWYEYVIAVNVKSLWQSYVMLSCSFHKLTTFYCINTSLTLMMPSLLFPQIHCLDCLVFCWKVKVLTSKYCRSDWIELYPSR